MKIAITGGAGFIGSHIAQAYLDAGHDVLVIDSLVNGSRNAVDPRARFYQVDIRDGRLLHILQQERPDVVSHHAAERESDLPEEHPLTDADVSIRGLLNVLDSCIAASVRKIIFASGGNDFYGCLSQRQLPVIEDSILHPQRPPAVNKIAGEWYTRYYTRQYGLGHTILRYADVYGEVDKEQAQHPLSRLIYMLLEDHQPVIRAVPHELRDHIFITDVVRANLCALERGQNQTVHISSGQGYSMEQFYNLAAHLLGSKVQPTYIPSRTLDSSSIVLDNAMAQRMLGWRPEIEFADGVKYTIASICENVGVTPEQVRATQPHQRTTVPEVAIA